jgi:hypothetical protein
VLSKTPMSDFIGKAVEIDNKLDIDRIKEVKNEANGDLNDFLKKPLIVEVEPEVEQGVFPEKGL